MHTQTTYINTHTYIHTLTIDEYYSVIYARTSYANTMMLLLYNTYNIYILKHNI